MTLSLLLSSSRDLIAGSTGRIAPFDVDPAVEPRGDNQNKSEARNLARMVPETAGVQVWGPAQAPLSLLRGRSRERLLVRADTSIDLPPWLRGWLGRAKLPGAATMQVDVEPHGFL